ncbi:MAG: response regulator transcription factor [Bacilli bacterium]|nr:response regulator transcription factor [Bacilli bacterium]
MINFIVCDDDKKYRNLVETIITKYMMKNEIEYKLHVFDDYNKDFMRTLETKMPFKIYILDIEAPTRSGIDIARLIRNKDVDSILIFLTGHQELSQVVIRNEFLFLAFINKFDDCENRLKNAIDKSLKILKTKKTIKFKDGGTTYTINLDDILYITKDSIERKSIIKTDFAKFGLTKPLTEIKKLLTANFVQTHRACLVNLKRVVSYSKPKKLITFDNGETIDLVSRKYERVLM